MYKFLIIVFVMSQTQLFSSHSDVEEGFCKYKPQYREDLNLENIQNSINRIQEDFKKSKKSFNNYFVNEKSKNNDLKGSRERRVEFKNGRKRKNKNSTSFPIQWVYPQDSNRNNTGKNVGNNFLPLVKKKVVSKERMRELLNKGLEDLVLLCFTTESSDDFFNVTNK